VARRALIVWPRSPRGSCGSTIRPLRGCDQL